MKRILFLPLLRMPSGHHQVATALIRSLNRLAPDIDCRKVDFLSYTNEWLEKAVTGTYLKWIHHSPHTYEKAYRTFASSSSEAGHHLQWYERLFLKKMQHMLEREQPDLIVCTHGFPSFLISRLKERGTIATPVINVYTDFFINAIWGRAGIDYHFVADEQMRHELRANGVPEERIFTTGIPVDDCFRQPRSERKAAPPYRILVSGGSNGLGHIDDLLYNLGRTSTIHYDILCGNNQRLYNEVVALNDERLQPWPYITSREEMNRLYSSADAVITKAGGVTVSEALCKRLPVFIYASLPGQETFNRLYLQSQRLIRNLEFGVPFDQQLKDVLSDTRKQEDWHEAINAYLSRLQVNGSGTILQLVRHTHMKKRRKV